MRYYPGLADKENVLAVYRYHRTQRKASAFFGCSEKTFRKALKYHKLNPKYGAIPEPILKVLKD